MKSPPPNKVQALLAEAQRELFEWVPVSFWIEMHPSENREKIRGRMRRGTWQRGVHAVLAGDREMWVHLPNARAWIEGKATAPPAVQPPGL